MDYIMAVALGQATDVHCSQQWVGAMGTSALAGNVAV